MTPNNFETVFKGTTIERVIAKGKKKIELGSKCMPGYMKSVILFSDNTTRDAIPFKTLFHHWLLYQWGQ